MTCREEIFFIAHLTSVTPWTSADNSQPAAACDPLTTDSRCQRPTEPLSAGLLTVVWCYAPPADPAAAACETTIVALGRWTHLHVPGDTGTEQGEHIAKESWYACPLTCTPFTCRDGIDGFENRGAELDIAGLLSERSVHRQQPRRQPALLRQLH